MHVMSWATRKRLKTLYKKHCSAFIGPLGSSASGLRAKNAFTRCAPRAAKNAAIDLLRQNKPCETLDDISMDKLSMERGDTTYSAAAAHSTEEYVGRFIQALPEKTKAIFSYRSLGLSDKEIAETLSITPDNVRTIAFRARKKLMDSLEREGLFCESDR